MTRREDERQVLVTLSEEGRALRRRAGRASNPVPCAVEESAVEKERLPAEVLALRGALLRTAEAVSAGFRTPEKNSLRPSSDRPRAAPGRRRAGRRKKASLRIVNLNGLSWSQARAKPRPACSIR